MSKYAFALVMALLMACSFAGWVAQVSGDYSKVDYGALKFIKAPDGTSFTVANDTASYKGHYGDYTVSATKTADGISVLISGADESMETISAEMQWLSKTGLVPKGSCSNFSVYEVSTGGYEACDGKVLVFYCPSCEIAASKAAAPATGVPPDSLPPVQQPAPAGAVPFSDSNAGVQSLAGGQDTRAAAPAPQGAVEEARNLVDSVVRSFSSFISGMMGQQTAAGASAPSGTGAAGSASKAASESQAAAPAQGGINGTQVLQLLAAFILVVIASYLILSSRPEAVQMQQVDPQVERLLQNETRKGIMNELSVADKIPTDLSNRLGKSKAAIVEHLAELMEAGLVERLETPGKKFVYYRLTQKGRQILLRKAA